MHWGWRHILHITQRVKDKVLAHECYSLREIWKPKDVKNQIKNQNNHVVGVARVLRSVHINPNKLSCFNATANVCTSSKKLLYVNLGNWIETFKIYEEIKYERTSTKSWSFIYSFEKINNWKYVSCDINIDLLIFTQDEKKSKMYSCSNLLLNQVPLWL